MPSNRAIIEFQETHCEIALWETEKANHRLKAFLRIPLRKAEAKAETPLVDNPAVVANAGAIRQALRDTGMRIREALVVIPKQWVTLRVVTLPTTEASELADMARFEAQRYIPFNVERHIIAYQVLSVEGIGGTRVILAAIDLPPAEEITAIMEAAGVRISALDVATTILSNALLASGQWNPEESPTVAHIHIGYASSDINIHHNGQLIFARSISIGMDKLFASASPGAPEVRDITPAMIRGVNLLQSPGDEQAAPDSNLPTSAAAPAQWASRLMTEIRRTYEFAHREFECEPLTRIFLTGPGAALQGLHTVIQSTLGTEAMELRLFQDRFSMDSETLPQAIQPATYAIAVGGMLRDQRDSAMRINLLPAAYLKKYLTAQRKKSLLTTAILATAFVATFIFFLINHAHQRAELIEFYEKGLEVSEERVREIEYRKTVVKILRENTSQKSSALAILNRLSGWDGIFGGNRMRVSISEFDYNAATGVKLSGWAWEYSDLNDFRLELEKSGHFRKVSTESQPIESFPTRPEQVVKFVLNCYFPQKEGSAE